MTDSASSSDDDFGYDLTVEEEDLLLQLTSENDISTPIQSPFTDTLDALAAAPADQNVPITKTNIVPNLSRVAPLSPPLDLDQEVSYPDLSHALSQVPPVTPLTERSHEKRAEQPRQRQLDDRSPLQRFRSYPRKPLTVTDLTSGAWCELQYWYTLTRLPGGRRTRTAAMKQGSKVHQKLEDEVHATVRIEITTKEDGFGLKLWNLVQGLRTLRDTGLTRELEVWGMVHGNLVNGVIDSLSYENPDPEFEEELSSQATERNPIQSSLPDYLLSKKTAGKPSQDPSIYLVDVKTRGSTAPVSKAQLKPAKIQLLLYHRLLSEMAAGELDFFRVFRRYGLDPDASFTDTFIAQVDSLHDEIFVDASQESYWTNQSSQEPPPPPPPPSSSSSQPPPRSTTTPDLVKYRSLRSLLPLVRHEIALTFPHGAHSVGGMLRVQYVLRTDGSEIDFHNFPVAPLNLNIYLDGYMQWWRGERKAEGVDIEEAFKCRTCEFAENCEWRQEFDQGMIKRAQDKVSAARKLAFP